MAAVTTDAVLVVYLGVVAVINGDSLHWAGVTAYAAGGTFVSCHQRFDSKPLLE